MAARYDDNNMRVVRACESNQVVTIPSSDLQRLIPTMRKYMRQGAAERE